MERAEHPPVSTAGVDVPSSDNMPTAQKTIARSLPSLPQTPISRRARNLTWGHCTQCNTWLGANLDSLEEQEVDDKTLEWQEWVISTLNELRVANSLTGILSWERFC